MKKLALLLILVGCGVDGEEIETKDGILISVKQSPSVTVSVSCYLDGPACHCEMSACGKEGIEAAAEQCWRLRNPIVVE